MINSKTLVLAIICAISVASCSSGRKSISPEQKAKLASERKAANDQIMQTATRVHVHNIPYNVGISQDRTYALVALADGLQTKPTASVLEQAAQQASNCDVIFPAGILAQIPGITNMTPLPIKSAARVELYCQGDTRKRAYGVKKSSVAEQAPVNILSIR